MSKTQNRIKLLITVTMRGTGTKIVDLYKRNYLHYDFICLGSGTATSEILDYLGLESTEKDVILTPIPEHKIQSVLAELTTDYKLHAPGRGIAFTIPLSSVSARVPQLLLRNEPGSESEGLTMEQEKKFELILAIINRGHIDEVMEAAKEAGAKGGTLLHARRVGYEDVDNIFGFTIQPEKEILAIISDTESKRAIMNNITEVAGVKTESHGLIMALPVDDLMGI